MTFTDIEYTKSDRIARITIDRQARLNAFTEHTVEEMTAAFEDAADDHDIGVIVLTGAGERAFSTGGDVSFEDDLSARMGKRFLRKLWRLSAAMRNNGKPIIAAIRGYCIGGGNELNLLCDLTIATEDARFGHVGPKMGSVPIWYGTQVLPRLVGEKRAREIVFLCRQYSAQDALNMGWINKVVPRDQLAAEVDSWCQEILERSPQALWLAKTSLNTETDALFSSISHGGLSLSMFYGTEEFKEGTRAFLEKRPPKFWEFWRK